MYQSMSSDCRTQALPLIDSRIPLSNTDDTLLYSEIGIENASFDDAAEKGEADEKLSTAEIEESFMSTSDHDDDDDAGQMADAEAPVALATLVKD
jgi:hypothetical protein